MTAADLAPTSRKEASPQWTMTNGTHPLPFPPHESACVTKRVDLQGGQCRPERPSPRDSRGVDLLQASQVEKVNVFALPPTTRLETTLSKRHPSTTPDALPNQPSTLQGQQVSSVVNVLPHLFPLRPLLCVFLVDHTDCHAQPWDADAAGNDLREERLAEGSRRRRTATSYDPG
jgi:hypothetical protein